MTVTEDPWEEFKREANKPKPVTEPEPTTFGGRLRARIQKPVVEAEVEARPNKTKARVPWSAPHRKRRRISIHSLEPVVAGLLILFYLVMSVLLAPSMPISMVAFVPTIWMLIAYLKLRTEKG